MRAEEGEAETASQPGVDSSGAPFDCKREWRRKGGCSGGFLPMGETEQVFRLRGEASGDSGLGEESENAPGPGG